MLSIGSTHPIRENCNETHFLADIDIFISQLKNQKTSGETSGKPQETNLLKKRGNISKLMGSWLWLLIRGLVLHNGETNV